MCSSGRRRLAAAAALAAAVAAAGLAGCGKRGDPEPPVRVIPRAAADLTAEQRGTQVILRFAYPQTTTAGAALPGIDRLEVFEVTRPLPEPPATPPPPPPPVPLDSREFAATATLRLALEGEEIAGVSSGGRLTLRLPVEIPERPEARWYAVRTAVGREVSGFSNQAVAVVETPPPAPGGIELQPRADGVAVSWTAPPAAGAPAGAAEPVGFQVYRREATERDFDAPVATTRPGELGVIDGEARYGHRYVYGVTAVGRLRPLVESGIAATAEIDYRDRFAPPPPTGLVALSEPGRVRLVWDASAAPDLAGYRVYRRRGEGEFEPLAPPDGEPLTRAEHQDLDLVPGEPVAYRVTAVDQLGNESAPAEVAVTAAR